MEWTLEAETRPKRASRMNVGIHLGQSGMVLFEAYVILLLNLYGLVGKENKL